MLGCFGDLWETSLPQEPANVNLPVTRPINISA